MTDPLEASRGDSASKRPAAGDPARLRLTDRDRAIASFVARWGPVTQAQVARRAGISRLPSFRRLQALREGRYLDYDRPVDELPGVFNVTARGAELGGRVTEAAGPPPPFALWPHLATVDEVIEAELAGLRTATRQEALADEELHEALPRTTVGTLVPPRAVLLDAQGPIAVYAVLRPAESGAALDEFVALTLESYLRLSSRVRRRILVSRELADIAAVQALRHAGAELVALDPGSVGRARG